ncbi:MAG: hypothetical protein ABFD54_18380 [Armatimonadota bacterium]|nr:hypothetical protein [bacterium]
MKMLYAVAILVMLLAAGSAFAADNQCYTQPSGERMCTPCPAPAWDRTPVCEVQTPSGICPPGVPRVDPWVGCGAFCQASQLSPGWPYGWQSEYWLRPNSNF